MHHSDTQISPRKPLVAALMSAILPGFGQLYNGQINKAIWLFVIFCLATVPLMAFVALIMPVKLTLPLVALTLALTLAVWVYGIVDGWRVAHSLSPYQTKPWQISGLYAAVFLICGIVILPAVTLWVRGHFVQAFHIPSGSMSPTVLRGDYLFANKSYNCPHCLYDVKRGDIAIFVYPDNRTQHFIKRVIALPGDHVVMKNNQLTINGIALSDSSNTTLESLDSRSWQTLHDRDGRQKASEDPLELTVKPGHAFVLGDNRLRSRDSRHFGQVPLSDIVGRARQIWFSKADGKIRWSRIGKSISH